MTEKTRYTDEELAEFRELISEKLQVAREQYEEVLATMNKRNSNDIDDTSPTFHALEEGSFVQTLEEQMASAQRLQKFITGLQAALVRIENKTYGICRVTKKLIPKERLRAVPHATLSIEAKLAQGK
ncbi:TraR/DksA family transcriptional regulator [Alloprevotella sp. OH1205_COT-284]|uniref:TraR/DksA family transcriptional regulator n=1 Tax=Alloprevotella sp. OH1205_COT-284 TaxID=2491043 RepID=UPI000F5F06E9|nr:TraR/DksA C4-type zinc finger protein [Alloprevotella sp. OH1205_COT-284]RRD77409.1 TraR/DksA family transcriptional regulator [Alloprevotella sp. OH1205_COT-284]